MDGLKLKHLTPRQAKSFVLHVELWRLRSVCLPSPIVSDSLWQPHWARPYELLQFGAAEM